MAEDIRNSDPRDGDLNAAHAALISECREQSRNTLYTSTSFFIWLRFLKKVRAALWVAAAISGAAAASTVLSKHQNMELVVAGLALLGVILPGAIKALQLDDAINAYAKRAGEFKNVEGALRRAANVWSNKPYDEFEKEARAALAQLDEARKGSLTPPEWCFKGAQRKIKSGDYEPDPSE
ncbi:hypothetical protein [Sinisalibacter aestuarii]|uniref:SMODS and SLOG-associating 2TM effector domain-containing protein n=1 Tax=Sinisalibacter aestuarii TaxID=2949426 RepID=A0ABQ5LWE8_9RHOB|nr:hypothetical protein [Sinisalibacter aestuarii]GKY89307.1 hypothetical protein STA1M1_31760 [Sinisalibacter aestuarii]